MYADAEKLLTGWLPAQLPGVPRCVTELPAGFEQELPVVQVVRFGGGDEQITLDAAHVDIDCFAADRAAAHDLAEAVRGALRYALPGQVIDGAVVARVQTISGPAWRPFDNTALRRVGASYRLTIHAA